MLGRRPRRIARLSSSPSSSGASGDDAAQRHGQSVGLLQIVGTPVEVADQMEAFLDHVGGDGFMLTPIYCPGAIEEFVDQVVPELQRRGRYRTDYAGATARDYLMQEG